MTAAAILTLLSVMRAKRIVGLTIGAANRLDSTLVQYFLDLISDVVKVDGDGWLVMEIDALDSDLDVPPPIC